MASHLDIMLFRVMSWRSARYRQQITIIILRRLFCQNYYCIANNASSTCPTVTKNPGFKPHLTRETHQRSLVSDYPEFSIFSTYDQEHCSTITYGNLTGNYVQRGCQNVNGLQPCFQTINRDLLLPTVVVTISERLFHFTRFIYATVDFKIGIFDLVDRHF